MIVDVTARLHMGNSQYVYYIVGRWARRDAREVPTRRSLTARALRDSLGEAHALDAAGDEPGGE